MSWIAKNYSFIVPDILWTSHKSVWKSSPITVLWHKQIHVLEGLSWSPWRSLFFWLQIRYGYTHRTYPKSSHERNASSKGSMFLGVWSHIWNWLIRACLAGLVGNMALATAQSWWESDFGSWFQEVIWMFSVKLANTLVGHTQSNLMTIRLVVFFETLQSISNVDDQTSTDLDPGPTSLNEIFCCIWTHKCWWPNIHGFGSWAN